MNKWIKSTATVKWIPGAATDAMKHHIKGSLEISSRDNKILHNEINNLKSNENWEKIASNFVSLLLSVKNEKTMVYISSLIIRNEQLDNKRKEVNDFIKQRCLTMHLLFIDNQNIKIGMLKKVACTLMKMRQNGWWKTFCFNVTKWYETILLYQQKFF